jgi:acetyl-CoA C-acetyltransferase
MAGSIRDRVAIVGMGCTKFGENWEKSADDLIVDAAYEAFEDAGLESKDIQAAWVGTASTSSSGLTLSQPLRLQYIPISRVENMCATGSDALRQACYAVAAGIYDIVLAAGVEKLKDSGYSGLGGAQPPGHGVHPQLTAPGAFAMLATRYFERYGLNPEEGKEMLAKVSVKSHYNGSLHDKAHFQRPITVEEALKAPIVSWPLGLFDCCGVSDGSAAAIVTTPEVARSLRPDPIYIKALQICVGPRDGNFRTDFDYTHVEETYRAGLAAYAEAGIREPRKEIGMAEVHDCFSITEAVIMEDLQFSARGKVKEDIDSGAFTLEGDLPINTDGGLKCFGHPIGASGLRMMYEVYKQLQGKADRRQVRNARLGLTHNLGGHPSGCVASVIIAGNELG